MARTTDNGSGKRQDMSTARFIQRRIVRAYTLALLLIAGAATGTYLTAEAVISEQSASARLINVSGRQRMLSQRISLEVLQFTLSTTYGAQRRLRQGIEDDLDTFTSSHLSIIEQSGGRRGMSDALQRLYYDADRPVDQAVRDFEQAVREVLAQAPGAAQVDAAGRIAEIAKTSLLEGLNEVVLQYQREAEARIDRLDRIESAIYVLTLLGLIIEVIFIFRPMVREIGRRTTELEDMTHRASHDELTGLPNRRYFYEQATAALALGTRKSQHTGLLHIDLDGFKDVNDELGHAAGDEVLRHVTSLLQGMGRHGDFAARLGGDEFVIMVADARSREDLEALANRLLHELSHPLSIQGHAVKIGASVGLAMVPPGARSVDAVLYESDMALYKAKAEGKANWKWFNEAPAGAG